MTRAEADQACERLGLEHPDRATHRWMPRRAGDGGWSVVKVGLAPASKAEDLKGEQRADEKPPTPDDPRPLVDPNWGLG
jgi:hypothetical protein